MKLDKTFKVDGLLGADAIVKQTQNSNFAMCSIAVTSPAITPEGEKTTATVWLDIKAWSKDPKAFDNLKKGRHIQFEGFLKAEEYDTKNGEHRQVLAHIATSWRTVVPEEKQEQAG